MKTPIDTKIGLEKDGASIIWSDQVEEEIPSWEDPRWSKAEVKQVKKKEQQVKKVARARRVVTEVVKPEKTYSHLFPLGDYLAMVLGEKGMKNLRRDGGAKSKTGLEEKYLEQMMRKPGVCKNPFYKNFMAFDVEKLEEEPLQRRIFEMESRPEIVTDEQGRHYVVLLGFSTPPASKVHCSINGLENSSSTEYSKVQHLFGIAVGLFPVGGGLFSVTVGLRKSPTPIKKVLLQSKKVLL